MQKNGVSKRLVLIFIGFILVFSTIYVCPVIGPTSPPDDDADGDGVDDTVDNCIFTYNPDQSDVDHDGDGDVCDTCTDTDNDGYGNPGYSHNTCPDDNCPEVSNPEQTDADNDKIGDACDTCPNDPRNDADHDGICGDVDNCPDSYNPDQKDADNDGIGDACETSPRVNFTYTPASPAMGSTLQFTDNTIIGGGILQQWQWTFGDTLSSTEQHPKHKYMKAGVYTVQLQVIDINGKTGTKKRNVTVSENHIPELPTIIGETNGTIKSSYDYLIQTTDPDQNDVKYYIDWGDNTNSTTDFYDSGKQITVSHTWSIAGTYSVRVKAVDEYNAESDWVTLSVTMPYSYKPIPSFLVFLLQRFPNAFPLLRQLID